MDHLSYYLFATMVTLGVAAVGMVLGLIPASWLPDAAAWVKSQATQCLVWIWNQLRRLARGWRLAWQSEAQSHDSEHWVLLLGEQQSGKTSLVQSLPAVRHGGPDVGVVQPGMPRAKWWPVDSSAWLIDLDGSVSAAALSPDQSQSWIDHLNGLCELRADRPVDAVVLTLRVSSLLEPQARLANAQLARRQLHDLRQQCAITTPVYLVLTWADDWPGFRDYWDVLPEALRDQMLGWSVPSSLMDQSPAAWSDHALDELLLEHHNLLLTAPALGVKLPAPESSLLFMESMRTLKAPLGDYLTQVFADDVSAPAFGVRGVYMSADLSGTGSTAPRCDISFTDDLFNRKVLRERGLARSTVASWWSRSPSLRTWQYSMLALCLALAGLVAEQLWWAGSRVPKLELAQTQLRQAKAALPVELPCQSVTAIDALLSRARLLKADLGWLGYLNPHPSHSIDDFVAQEVLVGTVLPAMRCELQQRVIKLNEQLQQGGSKALPIKGIVATMAPYSPYELGRARLVQDIEAIAALEQQVQTYQWLLTRRSESASQQIAWLAQLHQYLYGKAMPEGSDDVDGAVALSLVRLNAEPLTPGSAGTTDLGLNASLRSQWMRVLTDETTQTARALTDDVSRGPTLVTMLDQTLRVGTVDESQASVAAQAQNLYQWLNWIQTRWLTAATGSTPCTTDSVQLRAVSSLFSPSTYGVKPNDSGADAQRKALDQAVKSFDLEHCTQPAQRKLEQMDVPGYGKLINPQNGQLNSKLVQEASGLQSVVKLGYMQSQDLRPFKCNGDANRWSAPLVSQAQDNTRQYQTLVLVLAGLQPPLYDRVARYQLVRSVDDLLNRAQIREAGPNPNQTATDSSMADQQVLASSTDFSQVSEGLLNTLRTLGQLPYKSAFEAAQLSSIAQCTRQYADNALGQVNNLAVQSQLYQPKVDTQAATMLNLSPQDVANNYLRRQLARAQVLTGYADPFVAWLRNTEGLNDSHQAAPISFPFWNQTINEITRFTQYSDESGQVGALHSLLGQTLISMSFANCHKVLSAYSPGKLGDDLFSQQRQSLLQNLRMACSDRQTAEASQVYEQLAQRFNSELAGHYPFASSSAPEARLTTTRAFFVDYDAQRSSLAELVKPLKGKLWDQVRSFLSQLDAVNQLLRSNLAAGDAPAPIQLQVNLKPRRVGGLANGQIVSWSVTSGGRVISYPGESVQSLDWPFGQVLTLDINWADTSAWRPLSNPQRPDYSADGRTATFTEGGDWALIKWLQRDRAKPLTAADKLDSTLIGLEFSVPLQRSDAPAAKSTTASNLDSATLHLSMRMSAVDPQTKAQVRLAWPVNFPCLAPTASLPTASPCHEH